MGVEKYLTLCASLITTEIAESEEVIDFSREESNRCVVLRMKRRYESEGVMVRIYLLNNGQIRLDQGFRGRALPEPRQGPKCELERALRRRGRRFSHKYPENYLNAAVRQEVPRNRSKRQSGPNRREQWKAFQG